MLRRIGKIIIFLTMLVLTWTVIIPIMYWVITGEGWFILFVRKMEE